MILTQELWEEYTTAVPDEINWEDLVNSNLTTQACAAANATNWKLERVLKQNAELVEALEHLLRFVKTEFDPADIIVFKAQDAITKATGGV